MVIQIPMIRFYNKHELQYKPDIKKHLCEMQTNDIFFNTFCLNAGFDIKKPQ